MSYVNQRGDRISERQLFAYSSQDHTDEERNITILMLCEHLGVEVWQTNATKHGGIEIVLRKTEDIT